MPIGHQYARKMEMKKKGKKILPFGDGNEEKGLQNVTL